MEAQGGYTTMLKYIDQSCPQTLTTPNVIWHVYSLVPRPPFNPPRGKGGLVNKYNIFVPTLRISGYNLIG